MANLIKEELMVRPPKEAREAVARKVGLPMDMPVEEVIPMRAVYDIAKTVKNRARVMKQGRKPALSKAKPEVEADFLPDSEDMYIIRQDAGKVEEYGVVEQEPYYDNFGAVVDADVEVVSSDHVECHPCYSAIEVSDFKSFRLPSIFLEELSKLEQQKLIEKAQTMKVISTSRLGTNEEYNIVSDEKERKSFYVDLNVDVNVLPPYCECGYEGKRRICAHVLATLFQRIDGQYIMDLIEERILRELRVMKSTQLQRMRRALNTDVPSTSQASASSSVGH